MNTRKLLSESFNKGAETLEQSAESASKMLDNIESKQSLVERLRTRATIRRNIKDRKSVQEGKPDRVADLLEEAAYEIERLISEVYYWENHHDCTLMIDLD